MLWSICGFQNEGKTFFAMCLGYNDFRRGKTIITNMDLYYPHIKINKDTIFFLGEKQPNLNNVSFLFDELWIYLDCRKAIENTIASYFFLQSSKDSSNIYLTAQNNEQNELRIKQNLHKYTECQRGIIHNGKFHHIESENRDLGEPLNSFLVIECKTYIRKGNINNSMWILQNITYIKAKSFFNLYNTREKKVII
jgi:hypothetical protein